MRSRVFIVSVFFVSLSLRADEGESHSNDCGQNSLVLLLRLAGRDVGLNAVKQALPQRHDVGYSLGELQSTASKFGVHLSGVRLDKRDLPLIYPAIAFLFDSGEGHFIVLRPVGSNGKVVQVLDPPSAPVVMDYEQLLASPSWTGRVLVRQTLIEWFTSWFWLEIPCGLLLAWATMRVLAYFRERGSREPVL